MRSIPIAILVCLLVEIALSERAKSDCTIGVAAGSVAADGRPLLWKSRMWTGTNNQVVYYPGSPYGCIGARSIGDTNPMMGLNTAGLCTGNTLVGDGANGVFMAHVLRNFGTVAEVRGYIQEQYNAGLLAAGGCFPFMDALGDATMFEIEQSSMVLEYDAADIDRAAQGMLGWVVRANEFHYRSDGTDNTGIGGRYQAGAYNIAGLVGMDLLSALTIMQGNDGANGYEFMRYGPGRPLSTIAAGSVCSSMIVHGVSATEDAGLATMWIALGQSNYAIAVPTWAAVTSVPLRLGNGDMAARANSLYAKGNEMVTQASVLPLEAHLFEEAERLLGHWRTRGTPAVDLLSRVESRMTDDAYSLLNCLDNIQADNKAPLAVVAVSVRSGLRLDFGATATDEDGTIQAWLWDFGDGQTSISEVASHTYATAGWYVVSCTVTDDDGVSFTDWRYCLVPAAAADFDADGDVDAGDLGVFASCVSGPAVAYAGECGKADLDRDDDVDTDDFGVFQRCYSGEGGSADLQCGQ